MGRPDPNVSNGTCYYQGGKKLDKAFIPCGNDAIQHVPCCQAGDMCLGSNACFGASYGVTYLAGCTDDNYVDGSCPDKSPFSDSNWVGLIYVGDNKWSPCHQKAEPTLLAPPDPCEKPKSGTTNIAFTAPSVISNVGRLPLSKGGTVSWMPGKAPPTPTDDGPATDGTPFLTSSTTEDSSSHVTSMTSSITATESTATEVPSATSTEAADSPTHTSTATGSHSGMSQGQVAGIAVGVIAAVILLGIAAVIMRRRRRQQQDTATGDPPSGAAPAKFDPRPPHHPHGPRSPRLPTLPAEMGQPDMAPTTTPALSELGSNHEPYWSCPSELQGGHGPHLGPPAGYYAGPSQPQRGEFFPPQHDSYTGAHSVLPPADMRPVDASVVPISPTSAFSEDHHGGHDHHYSLGSMSSINSQPGVLPVRQCSAGTATGPSANGPRHSMGSVGEMGSMHSNRRVSTFSPRYSASSQQLPPPHAYPGQPLPYQPYLPVQSAPQAVHETPVGTVPAPMQPDPESNKGPGNLKLGPDPRAQDKTVFELA
ncbi:hypothetical protein V8F33_002319 [Rhypophila sp. PSN 637]